MSAPWTVERLRALSPKQLETLHSNAKAIRSPQSEHIVSLIAQYGLVGASGRAIPQRSGGSREGLGALASSHVKANLKPWTQYQKIVVESYQSTISGTTTGVHVRPANGEIFRSDMKVECSRAMRLRYPVGTRFRIHAKVVEKDSGNAFLYTHPDWPYEVVKEVEAMDGVR